MHNQYYYFTFSLLMYSCNRVSPCFNSVLPIKAERSSSCWKYASKCRWKIWLQSAVVLPPWRKLNFSPASNKHELCQNHSVLTIFTLQHYESWSTMSREKDKQKRALSKHNFFYLSLYVSDGELVQIELGSEFTTSPVLPCLDLVDWV